MLGRPGPAVLDITMDAQMETVENIEAQQQNLPSFEESLSTGLLPDKNLDSNNMDFESLFNQMNESKNPVILVGGGAHIAKRFI